MLSKLGKVSIRVANVSSKHSIAALLSSSSATTGSRGGEENIRVHSSILKDMYEKASAKKTEELLEKQQGQEQNPEDEGIHPDWLAMERRVKFKKPRPKTSDFEGGRTTRRPSAWDGENV